ncbi:hypothetical protein [Prauserella cavernicola]|uniref:WXG100 family type VII secretion target n=1 Tax=Prauserella cavernicola TaxID=2800127 RepID=A0A934QQE4_9PSEU|nr:hypothetical protein [Prauserella cavernicola]MBK1783578.1 hypothetical protein [Prauserella cavernicola]
MSFTVDKEAVADFGYYLGAEAGQALPLIERLARDEGMSDHGFTGLLEPLGAAVNGPSSVLVGTAFSEMQRKLCDLGDGVLSAASSYGVVDHSNAALIQRAGLEGDTNEEIAFGGYGRDGFDNHTEDGGSRFQYTQTDIPDIERPDTKYSDDVPSHGMELKVLDWIWSEFNIDGGKGFTDSIISPLAGNYKSIEANGEAWESVGKNFGLLAANLGANSTTLATHHWEGPSGELCKEFLDVFWDKGAAWAGEQMGLFVSSGFAKIADVSKKIADIAIRCINTIIKVARKIATKALPVVGWAWTAIQSAGKWLGKVIGIDIDDLYDDIMLIKHTAQEVFALYQAINDIVTTMQEYFTTIQELVETVRAIPEIGGLSDAVSTAETINGNREQLRQQQDRLTQSVGDARGALTELDGIARDVAGSR